MYPLNAWYCAGWAEEIGRDLVPRTICGTKVVLYRTESGAPTALADACWHRLVPLSMGRLRGDDVMCGYHGIAYNPEGRCTFMPSQETINPSAAVRSFPVVDRHRLTWIWMGDAELVDPDAIPDLSMADDPRWAGGGDVIELDCDYRLVLDNLMDLTHETYLHGTSIGNQALAEAPFTVEHTDATVTVRRSMWSIAPPPAAEAELRLAVPGYDGGPIDRWQIIRWQSASTIVISAGVAVAGSGAENGDGSKSAHGFVINTVTPESDGTSRYYWMRLRGHSLDDEALTESMVELVGKVFGEDTVMLNAQQKAIDAHPGYDFYNLNIDAGGLWVRRLLDRIVAAEADEPLAAVPVEH